MKILEKIEKVIECFCKTFRFAKNSLKVQMNLRAKTKFGTSEQQFGCVNKLRKCMGLRLIFVDILKFCWKFSGRPQIFVNKHGECLCFEFSEDVAGIDP